MDWIAAIVLGIAMGITEFLPVSSLGHSLVLEAIFHFPSPLYQALELLKDPDAIEKAKIALQNTQNVIGFFIEGGAVLAVVVYYARDLLAEARKLPTDAQARQLLINVIIAFVPIGVFGLLLNSKIQAILFRPWIIGVALIVGGIIFLLVEQRKYAPTTTTLETITPRQALTVGVAQIAALIPGISRSGSTIVGGLLGGLSRETATHFTFYLFIPTLVSAVGYEMYTQIKDSQTFSTYVSPYLPYMLLAAAVAFVVSLFTIRFLLRYVSNHDFKPFGVYRIIVGVVIIVLAVAKVI